MGNFTPVLGLGLLFLVGIDASCEIIPDVECMVGGSIKENLPNRVSTTCTKCICIEYKQATAVQCCSIALVPTGYDKLRCEVKLNDRKCIYTVREIEPPHKPCRFSGYIM
ncbi:beta-microseminoprotein-like [Acanthaster planci]|uniref:Beta-microseminoprotein-like n=1 Tax=Acanthaster planci TaxID=133434 RepID=A0A8B7YG87_ACAPL|nr:beta-microseminoprotein-like [Acanthaster planci]